MENTNAKTDQATFITTDALLAHWLGHRRVTRRVIEAFPEDKLFTYSVGGMRPFSELVMEMITMGAPGLRGIVEDRWEKLTEIENRYTMPQRRADLLELWDVSTKELTGLWPQIAPHRFQEVVKVFNAYEGKVYWNILYFIDNEIHHRAQGYVYLRSLGIEPPHFAVR